MFNEVKKCFIDQLITLFANGKMVTDFEWSCMYCPRMKATITAVIKCIPILLN